MRSLLITSAALVSLALSAHAGDILVQATGTVFSATHTSGPFMGITVGSTAYLSFEVFYPGTPQSRLASRATPSTC